MYNELEDRIAKAALAGAMTAGALSIAAFAVTGAVTIDAATSTISLTFDPASQGLVFGTLLVAGLLKISGRIIRPVARWLADRS